MLYQGREVEIKLAMPSVSAARQLLRAGGFSVSKRRVFEQNAVFDTDGQTLRSSSRLLRIRQVGKVATLTYKGPPEAGKHKSREELELHVDNAKLLGTIFERLEFRPVFRYDKFRTEFQAKGSRGVATLDETPVGVYLELEGSPQWIDRTARKLGFEEKDYITASYARLYLEWCKAKGTAATNMLFS